MKDPAVLFYTQDFITGTILMTDEQRGKYIMLLCLQHQNGKLTERDMLKICGVKDEDIWAKFYQENGFYYNKRMLLETQKRNNYTESRRKNLQKTPHMDVHMEPHMENENEDVNINKNEKEEKEELLKRKEAKFKSEVFEYLEKYNEAMLNKFCDYWTEKSKSGKMRYEFEKTFEIPRRLTTWASRDKDIIKSTSITLTYDEILKLAEKEPDIWKKYKAVKRDGERKAVFELIRDK
jgi:hypothetical protein